MVKRIVGWVVLVPFCVLLVLFALANRQPVVVNFNPFAPADSLAAPEMGVPLFLVIYVILLVGVLLGGIATWFAQSHIRREKKQWRREAEHLTRELDAARKTSNPSSGRNQLADIDDVLDRP